MGGNSRTAFRFSDITHAFSEHNFVLPFTRSVAVVIVCLDAASLVPATSQTRPIRQMILCVLAKSSGDDDDDYNFVAAVGVKQH